MRVKQDNRMDGENGDVVLFTAMYTFSQTYFSRRLCAESALSITFNELYVTKEATLFSTKIEEILVIKISDKLKFK